MTMGKAGEKRDGSTQARARVCVLVEILKFIGLRPSLETRPSFHALREEKSNGMFIRRAHYNNTSQPILTRTDIPIKRHVFLRT